MLADDVGGNCGRGITNRCTEAAGRAGFEINIVHRGSVNGDVIWLIRAMKMQHTYGIFDNEADHLVAMVRQHDALTMIVNTPCPACGGRMAVAFNNDGTGFSLSCDGEPMHMTIQHEIDDPPEWWRQCYEKPTDVIWYWRAWHSFDENGTLHMNISGWQADDERWSGELECTRDHPDYELWRWIIDESGCTEDLISDTDLDELRTEYSNAK